MDNFCDAFNERQDGFLPGHLGFIWTHVSHGLVRGRVEVAPHLMSPNGFLHAGSVVTLADTACGFGAIASKPEAAYGFTTIELKSNFLGTAREGFIGVEARMVHGGRTTQVWDSEVKDEASDKSIALFRCTQMLLYPK